MKIFVNDKGQVIKIIDNLFVANASWVDNEIKIYFGGDNSQISFCNISFKRADGMKLLNFMAEIGEDDDGIFWRYQINDNDGVLFVPGALEISAQLIKATYEELELIKREVVSTVTASGFVQNNIGIDDVEEYDRVLNEVTTIRDILSGKITENDTRITNIEDANPMTNFTSNVSSGFGTKFFLDGTTATIPLATGSCVELPDIIPLSIITFTTANWSFNESEQDYEIAFAGAITGRENNNYMAAIDELVGSTYEQAATRIIKGSDGSVLVYGVGTPFTGRLLLFGGTVQINEGEIQSAPIQTITRNGELLPIISKNVDIIVPTKASEIEFENGETTTELALIDVLEQIAELNSSIGDIGTALDLINGEVIL